MELYPHSIKQSLLLSYYAFYRFSAHAYASHHTRSEGTGQLKPQRQTGRCWQSELVVHEDVVDKQVVVSAGHNALQNLFEKR